MWRIFCSGWAEDSRISKTQGTGLGMTITDNIVRMMNGTIEIKSKLGEGSLFIFAVTLPLSQDREAPAGELKGHTVLVVDDDQAVCQSATELLAELGMGGEWALSSQEAITLSLIHILSGGYSQILTAHTQAVGLLSVIPMVQTQAGAILRY